MTINDFENRSLAHFPKWIGPLWLFLVFLEKGWAWQELLIYGGIPWVCSWAIWTSLAHTSFIQSISSTAVDAFWRCAAGALWFGAVSLGGGIYYVNHYLPSGPMYATGDVVCQKDDRGPCGAEYKEDYRNLDIPYWATLLKGSEAELLLMALIVAGIIASSRPRGGYREDDNEY